MDRDVSDCNLEELPNFQNEVEMHFAKEGSKMKGSEDGIPTLETVFQKYPDMLMNIEIKTPSINAIKELKSLITKYERVSSTLIGISSLEKELSNIFPESYRFFSYGTLPRLFALYFTGLLPFVQI